MPQVLRRENLTISIGTYEKDGATKQRYKTIGELITMQGGDGSVYQFGEMWGPTGNTKFNVYEQQDQNNQAPQQKSGYQQPPQGQAQYAQPQAAAQKAPAEPYGQPQQPVYQNK